MHEDFCINNLMEIRERGVAKKLECSTPPTSKIHNTVFYFVLFFTLLLGTEISVLSAVSFLAPLKLKFLVMHMLVLLNLSMYRRSTTTEWFLMKFNIGEFTEIC